ncbi:MAG: glycosyltransferase [Vicinamibacterales bacterium]
MATHVCTIVARNYLPYARVLADSFFAHHPGGSFTVLVIDDEGRAEAWPDPRVRWRRLRDIGLERREIHRLAAMYDVTELATAVKPKLLRHLRDTGSDAVLYFDPDIRLYDSLDEIAELARQRGIVLTPHTMRPFPKDDRRVNAFFVLAAGVYNLGFIGIGPGSDEFLEWWWQVTRREALVDVAGMMFTDQRWVDFAPCFFDPYILKDPACNVAYWNLHGRNLTLDGERYLVDGRPLRFFHFSGFNPKQPGQLSRHQGDRPRILTSDRPPLAQICREYASSLEHAGVHENVPYGWGWLACGMPIDSRMRRAYWAGVTRAEQGRVGEPPDPFNESDRYGFVDWLNDPADDGPPRVSRYLYTYYKERSDLQRHFPDLFGRDVEPYLAWVRVDGVAQTEIPAELLPAHASSTGATPEAGATSETAEGLTIAGYFRAELGIGESARLLTLAADAAGIAYATMTYDKTLNRQSCAFEERPARADHDVNVLCINADSTVAFARHVGSDFFARRHTAGYWFWELEDFPPTMHQAFGVVDEVWAATDFVANAIRKPNIRPVFTMPVPVPTPRDSAALTRAQLGLPDGFAFLFVFDFLSIVERKNPMGLVRAFTQAFAPNEGPVLMLKCINGHLRTAQLDHLRSLTKDRSDIRIVDDYYTSQQKDALLCRCDCYVSLHRSEGLGLSMAESMAAGKPVIATGYSGNLHFMTSENSYLVDYTTGAVPGGCDPYPTGAPWAEPDLGHAATLMREVYERPDLAAIRARRASVAIRQHHTVEVAAAALSNRLDQIRSLRRSRVTTSLALGPPNPSTWPLLETLASPQVGAQGRSFPKLRVALQRTLFRALRPYWFQQSEFNGEVIRVVRQLTSALRREQHARVDLQNAIRRLTQRSNGTPSEGRADSPRRARVDVTVCIVQHENAADVRRILGEMERITRSSRTFETIVIHNDESMVAHDGCLNYHNRNVGQLAGATNKALELAVGQYFVYLCGSHTHIVSADWLDTLVDGLGDGVIGGTLTRSDGRQHIQGGVFVARTHALRQVAYDPVRFPFSWMDQDISERMIRAGHDLTHIEGMMSVMGHLPNKQYTIYHSHS